MKTLTEVVQWVDGAAAQFDDPAKPIGMLFAKFEAGDIEQPRPELVTARWAEGALWLNLPFDWLPLDVAAKPVICGTTGAMRAYGLEQVSDSLWAISPSLNMPGELHVFVVVYDVPTPAPWSFITNASCEVCGCTEDAACTDLMVAGPCAWVREPTADRKGLCSVCARKDQ